VRAPRLHTVVWILAASAGVLALAACQNLTPYHRVLPAEIERVYVPMAKNKTYEPGLEELITNGFTTELLADGRLELVRKRQSDAVIQVTVEEYNERTRKFESDDIERSREISLILKAELFDRDDLENPFAHTEEIPVKLSYTSDYRSSYAELDVDARERLARETGRRLLMAVMNEVKLVEGPGAAER